jgi:DNA-binding transcriptional LysR family regulator
MNTTDLDTFISVVMAGSFAEAARQKGIDPSLVSRSIAALENELGFRLLNRTTRKVSLTEAGQAYFERISTLLAEMEEARDASRNLSSSPQGTLRVTTSVAFGHHKIVPLLGKLTALCPDLKVELILTDSVVDLVAERIDVAIRLGPRLDTGFAGFPLLRSRYKICASPGYITAHGAISSAHDLSNHQCLLFPLQGYRSRWLYRDQNGVEGEVNIDGTIVISSALGLLQATLDGVGPCLLADWLVDDYLKKGTLVEICPHLEWSATDFETAAWVLYPTRKYLPQKTRFFIDFIKEHAC